MKRNFGKPILVGTLLVMAIGWLLFVWVPMMQRDAEIDPQQVLRDSKATTEKVRSELQQIQKENADGTIPSDSLDEVSPETK